MSRKTRTLLISLIALAVIAGAYVILQTTGSEPAPPPMNAPVEPVVLSDVPSSDLRSVLVENTGGGYQLYSSDGTNWKMADTGEFYRLDAAGALTAIRNFSRLSGQEMERDADASRLREFGLENPETRVTLRDSQGRNTVLEFGSLSPSGTGRFARNTASGDVALIPTHVSRAADAVTNTFRDLSLPALNLQAMLALSYKSGDTVFIAEPRTEEDPYVTHVGPFDIVSPYRGRYALDDNALSTILTETYPLPTRVQGWLDDADPADPALGFDTADFISVVDREGGALMLEIGASDGEGRRYARLGDRDEAVFLLNEDDIGLLQSKPFDLLGKFLFLANIVNVSQVKVETEGKVWIMHREEMGEDDESQDDKYYINDLPVQHKEFSSLYQKFIGIMWEGEIPERKSIEFPVVRITVSHETPGIENRVIRFWDYDDVYYQASVGDNPLEFLVGKYQVEMFLEELKALAEYAS